MLSLYYKRGIIYTILYKIPLYLKTYNFYNSKSKYLSMHFNKNKNGRGSIMLDFKKELEKFEPILGINQIEEQVSKQDITDIIDVLKAFDGNGSVRKEFCDKE